MYQNEKVINKKPVDKSLNNLFSDIYSFIYSLSAIYKTLINKWIVRLENAKTVLLQNIYQQVKNESDYSYSK